MLRELKNKAVTIIFFHIYSERYANHILWMTVCCMILTVWDSTRKKIWLGGEVLSLSKQPAARV